MDDSDFDDIPIEESVDEFVDLGSEGHEGHVTKAARTVCAVEDGEDDDSTPDEHDATFAEHFAPYFRKQEEYACPLEFMLTSAECISSKIRPDLDDAEADHTPLRSSDTEDDKKPWANSRKRYYVIQY